MPPDFFRTLRSLDNDPHRGRSGTALLALVLFAAWLTWGTMAQVAVLEVSERGRVEVETPPLPLSAPVAGRLTLFKLALNQRVESGQIVAELDSSIERQRLAEEAARLTGLEAELQTLRRELEALRQAQRAEQQVARLSDRVAMARVNEAGQRTAQAEEVAARYQKLVGSAAEIEIRRTQSEAGQKRAAQAVVRVEAKRLRRDRRALKLRGLVRIEELERELAVLATRKSTTAAGIATVQAEIDRRVLRAPVTGFIDAVMPLGTGAFVQAGDTLGLLLPVARLHIVALYQPAAAFGRIVPGQRAWMRLSGFPFTQYGRLALVVTHRANELRDGLVRVELAMDPSIPFSVPLQHGLPGVVDIEIERISPIRLLLRAVGTLGTQRGPTVSMEKGVIR